MDERIYSLNYELMHKVDTFTPTLYLEINHLELMKIQKALAYVHSSVLARRIKRYLIKIAKQYDEELDFEKRLPLRLNEDE